MAQTANKKKQQPAIERYNKATLVKQRLIWLYFQGENTNNHEGLSPEGVVGGIIDYRIAGVVKQYITADKFAYQAKQACQIALDLHAEGEHIKEPELPDKNNTEEVELPAARSKVSPAFDIEVEGSDDDYEEEEVEEGFKTPSPKKQQAASKSTPRMPTKKTAPPKKVVSIDELTKQFDGTKLEGLPQMASAGLGFPVLCGRYTEDKIVGPFKVESKHYTLIRMIPHNCLTAKMVTLEWTDKHTLRVTIRWPSFFWKIGNHIAFQKDSTTPATFHFTQGHQVFNSVMRYLEQRADLTDENNPKINDVVVFKFDNAMDTTFGYSEVLDVLITEDDVDLAAGEAVPVGDTIKVHQIILMQATPEDEKLKTIKTSARKTKTGKSIDPEGSKVGGDEKESTNAYDYTRFASLYVDHGLTPPRQEIIDGYSGAEEDLFYVVSFLMENNKSLLNGDFIPQVMNQYDGRPVEMMKYVEDYVTDAADAAMIAIETIPLAPPSPPSPQLQLANGPTTIENSPLQVTDGSPAVIEAATAMDTREKFAKRRREVPLTRAQSQKNVESTGN